MTTPTQIDAQPPSNTQSRRCTVTCADGSPCRAWAVRGSDPPRCAPHGGGRAPAAAPLGNQNARTHGFYATNPRPEPPPEDCTIDDVIIDLHRKRQALSAYIDERMPDLSPPDLARLSSIHAQHCSRIGRLLRDRHILNPHDDFFSSAITEALAELSEELGTDLI